MLNQNREVIFAFHYSAKIPLLVEIIASSDEVLRIKVSEKNLKNNIFVGDPIVLGFTDRDSEMKIVGCDVSKCISERSELEVTIDKVHIDMKNRLYNRLPVSFCSDIKDLHSNKSYNAFVKDISRYGILIYCKAMIPMTSKVRINMHLEDSGIFFDAEIVRIVEAENYNTYGLFIPGSDFISSRSVNKLLRAAYESFLKKINPEIKLSIAFDELQFARTSAESLEVQKLNDHTRMISDMLKNA